MGERVGLDVLPPERMALDFLSRGPDRIAQIDTEEVFAAAVVYCDLSKRGFVTIDPDPAGPIITITNAGRAILTAIAGADNG